MASFDPRFGDRREVVVECSGDDPIVGFVGVEGDGIAGSQLQGRGGLPVVREAVQVFELVDSAGGAQLGEQATTADGLQLAIVTDPDEAPLVRLGEARRVRAGPGWRSFRLHRRPPSSRSAAGTRVVAVGRAVAPFVEQLGDRVGANPGVPFEYPGRFRGRGDTEHPTMLRVQVVDGGGKHPGLARPGRADHQHQTVVAGDTERGVGLQHIETRRLDGPRRSPDRLCASIAHVTIRSSCGEHRLGREPSGGRLDPQRPTVRRPTPRRRLVGSKSTQRSSKPSQPRSIAAAQRCPDICDTGRCRSQIAWTTSGGPTTNAAPTPPRQPQMTVSESHRGTVGGSP